MDHPNIPKKVTDLYTWIDYRHAAAILNTDLHDEFMQLCDALAAFRFTEEQVKAPGGNESQIPKEFSNILRPMGWIEKSLTGKLVVEDDSTGQEVVTTDTHSIDYLKNGIAFDLEWNSKDQTFDRDLYAFRAFFEFRRISVGVLVTRDDESLAPYFASLGTYVDPKTNETKWYKSKYGASTTHMAQLRRRLDSGRSGGCPVLALGITKKLLKI